MADTLPSLAHTKMADHLFPFFMPKPFFSHFFLFLPSKNHSKSFKTMKIKNQNKNNNKKKYQSSLTLEGNHSTQTQKMPTEWQRLEKNEGTFDSCEFVWGIFWDVFLGGNWRFNTYTVSKCGAAYLNRLVTQATQACSVFRLDRGRERRLLNEEQGRDCAPTDIFFSREKIARNLKNHTSKFP